MTLAIANPKLSVRFLFPCAILVISVSTRIEENVIGQHVIPLVRLQELVDVSSIPPHRFTLSDGFLLPAARTLNAVGVPLLVLLLYDAMALENLLSILHYSPIGMFDGVALH
jgi:hypothetical protein